MRAIVGARDILFVTLDTLRYDVAHDECAAGRTPNLSARLPGGQWEQRHAPASFTYASHQAFFAGFLPTPTAPGRHSRLFALRFEGSETTGATTCIFDTADIVTGLRQRGYHTICIGGTGFFNKQNPLGCALPSLFDVSHWDRTLGVRDPRSTEHQVARALSVLDGIPKQRRVFLFVNVSALHQPNHFYVPGATSDSIETHAAALRYVDGALAPLFSQFERRGGAFCIVCSDHGTCYGEDGYHGHRIGHPVVWNVPYAEFMLAPR